MAKKPDPVPASPAAQEHDPVPDAATAVAREPVASYDCPVGLQTSEWGLAENRTINAWALDRVLGYLGISTVEIIDAVAMAPDGRHVELVRDGDTLKLFDKL